MIKKVFYIQKCFKKFKLCKKMYILVCAKYIFIKRVNKIKKKVYFNSIYYYDKCIKLEKYKVFMYKRNQY